MNGAAAYSIPPGNPFPNAANPTALPEIWAYGLRNPFRFSIDRLTGDLLIGDVGQDVEEEIDLAPMGVGALNFGWRVMEGTFCTGLAQLSNPPCNDSSLTLPILEYADAPDPTQSAVIGGVRYRGTRLIKPGTYLYADFYDGVIRQGVQDAQGNWSSSNLLSTGVNVSAFGQDKDGEVYFVSYGGTLYKLNPVDTDGDGLPDWWESQYFGSSTAAVPSDDSDGDGLTNAQEFLAGTDPRSGASALRVSGVAGNPSSILIDFPSVFGKSYQLEYKNDLSATTWISLGTPIPGTGAIVEASDSSAAGTFRFYRVRLL
jgi:hypothetical protein